MATKNMTFKADFELLLKNLGVKTRFLSNLSREMQAAQLGPMEKLALLNSLNTASHWELFISLAFKWNNTPEGYAFWNDVYTKIKPRACKN